MPDNNEIVLIRLREAIEAATGRQMRTPKDFSFLSERIFDKLHEHISPTTLKRLWGYLHDTSSTPRPSTLDLLAQFIDYPDFDTFATTVAPTFATTFATTVASTVNTTFVPTTSPGDTTSPTEAAASDESPAPANNTVIAKNVIGPSHHFRMFPTVELTLDNGDVVNANDTFPTKEAALDYLISELEAQIQNGKNDLLTLQNKIDYEERMLQLLRKKEQGWR